MLRLPDTKMPPAHPVDAVPMYIYAGDLALDHRRFLDDQDKLSARAVPGAMHPLGVYWAGETRFALEAKITIPDVLRTEGGPATATVDDYMLPGKQPTRFEMRDVGSRNWIVAVKSEALEFEFVRRGLVRVHDAIGEDGKPTVIDPPRDGDGFVSAEWLDSFDGDLVLGLGRAIRTLSKNEVAFAEGKP